MIDNKATRTCILGQYGKVLKEKNGDKTEKWTFPT